MCQQGPNQAIISQFISHFVDALGLQLFILQGSSRSNSRPQLGKRLPLLSSLLLALVYFQHNTLQHELLIGQLEGSECNYDSPSAGRTHTSTIYPRSGLPVIAMPYDLQYYKDMPSLS